MKSSSSKFDFLQTCSFIWRSASEGDLEAIRRHIAAGTDLNGKEPAGGSTPLIVAALFGRTQAAKLLIENKAGIDVTNKEGGTALHLAAFFGHEGTARMLLEKKAAINVKNKRGHTPLDTVADDWSLEIEGIYKFVGGLLKIQLDLDAIQAARPKIAELLREQGGKHGRNLAEK